MAVSALSLAAGVGVQAQQQDKPAAPAPASAPAPAASPLQDRVAIVGQLDSWYKVLYGEKQEHVGHVHERLTKETAGQPWRYVYQAEAEVEFMAPDPTGVKKLLPFMESLVLTAQLDDTYSPQSLKQTDIRNNVEVHSEVLSEESGRKISVKLGSQDRKMFPVGDEEVYFSRFLMFVALRQSGNLAKPGTRKLSLFAPRVDDKMPVVEIQIEIRDVEKREYLGKKDLPVTKVVYLKPPPASARELELSEAYIDKFGRIVEETTRGGMRRVLVKGQPEAMGSDTRFRHGARRDPFRKDLAMTPPRSIEEGDGPKGPTVDPDNMAVSIKKAQERLEELRRAKEDGREVDGQKIYESLVETHIVMKRTLAEKPQPPNVQADVERIRDEAEKIWGGLDRLMKKLRGVYVRVLQHFDKDECEDMQKGIDELKKAGLERKELVDRAELGQVNQWIGELEPLVVKCRTRQELARKPVVLTGTLIHDSYQFIPVDARVMVLGHPVGAVHPVRFMKPDRLAVVNDKMYRVGDTVEGQGIRVEKIWAHGIQVSLREETRDIPIRQK